MCLSLQWKDDRKFTNEEHKQMALYIEITATNLGKYPQSIININFEWESKLSNTENERIIKNI